MKYARAILAGLLGLVMADGGLGLNTLHFWIVFALVWAYGAACISEGFAAGTVSFREFVREQVKNAGGKIKASYTEE